MEKLLKNPKVPTKGRSVSFLTPHVAYERGNAMDAMQDEREGEGAREEERERRR